VSQPNHAAGNNPAPALPSPPTNAQCRRARRRATDPAIQGHRRMLPMSPQGSETRSPAHRRPSVREADQADAGGHGDRRPGAANPAKVPSWPAAEEVSHAAGQRPQAPTTERQDARPRLRTGRRPGIRT
jgi:hypothetical protein